MEDKEMLEMAAKAAGIKVTWEPMHGCYWIDPGQDLQIDPWEPLADDGQALRLAVRLGISVDNPDPERLITSHNPRLDAEQEGIVTATIRGDGYRYSALRLKRWFCALRWVSIAEFKRVKNCKDTDLVKFWRENSPQKFENAYTATRRAIVRAAAEIWLARQPASE